MASQGIKALENVGLHHVGNINSWKIEVLQYGALVDDATIDNFTSVEIGFNADGERICKQLTDVTKAGFLIASVERRLPDEQLSYFYNEQGERARLVYYKQGLHFESSAFSKNTGVTEIKKGFVAHFDPTTKTYIISDPASAHLDYATAHDKFTVIATEDDIEYTAGKPVVRFEVQ